MNSFLKPFRSVRFNIWLFLLIATVSAAGTFIPPKKIDIFHSWWFGGLLALMAFDVIVCKLRRWPGKNPPKSSIETLQKKSVFKALFKIKKKPKEILNDVRAALEKNKFLVDEAQPLVSDDSQALVVLGTRQRIQRWGDFILHVSIVIILTGSLIGAIFGFDEALPIVAGSSTKMKNRPYEVFLKNFDIEYYRSTNLPSQYVSDLVVTEADRVLGQKKVMVNHPLDIHHVRFYQATWGMTDQFKSARIRLAGRIFVLKPFETVPIPGTSLAVRANYFIPTFDVDENQRPITRDYEGKNPALQVDFLKGDRLQIALWLLKNKPETAFEIQKGRVFQTSTPPFQLADVEAVLFSGIQVGYDPGAPLFWLGAGFLLLGLCLHFYCHQRQLTVILFPKGASTDVFVGGWNSRTPEDFKEEFERCEDDIRTSIEV